MFNKDITIGVIGIGYVGKACVKFFSNHYLVHTYDIKEPCTENSIDDLINKSHCIFICVPTPMQENGSCDLKILEEVLNEFNNKKSSVVIKSTVPPGTSEKLAKKFHNLDICFNPEFLTESNFIDDFKNQNRIILGGSNSHIVNKIYSNSFPNSEIINCKSNEAELVKYFTNAFLATKVAFANEFYSLCKEINIDFNKIVSMAILDKRLGDSHFQVPGPDGKFGFGGTCLPKDLCAIIKVFKDSNIAPHVLDSVWNRNLTEDRTEQDWKNSIGRAVSE